MPNHGSALAKTGCGNPQVMRLLCESTEVIPSAPPRLESGIHGEEIPHFPDFPLLGLPTCPRLFQLFRCLRPVRVVDAMLATRAVL